MQKSLKRKSFSAAFLVCGALLAAPLQAAGPQLVPVVGVAYNVNADMRDNLRDLQGKRVTVRLRGASVVAGRIKSVGDHMLHLETLDQKEHFDALIPIAEIVALETRFRQYPR